MRSTVAEFFEAFRRYDEAVWPLPWILPAAAAVRLGVPVDHGVPVAAGLCALALRTGRGAHGAPPGARRPAIA